MSQQQQLDYLAGLRESVNALDRELTEGGVRDGLTRIAQALGLDEDVTLAAVYRESRRNGYSLRLMVDQLEEQIELAKKRQATQ
ncbi:MAG TPA: hypothetical protein VHL09_04770 [Dehalococcoidia bacterium]|nr:hypothetical protein [Dehalococcoidia bacterium]